MTTTAVPAEETETIKLPISADDKTTILLNVEGAVKELINKLASKKEELFESEFIDGDKKRESILNALPNSMTGVVVHYLVKGLKDDFDVEFAEQPVSLKVRGGSIQDRKVSGKKRLLTKEEKNELLAKMQMTYYETDMMTGKMTIDEVMTSIKTAFEEKKKFEDMGYILPMKKNEAPYWENKE